MPEAVPMSGAPSREWRGRLLRIGLPLATVVASFLMCVNSSEVGELNTNYSAFAAGVVMLAMSGIVWLVVAIRWRRPKSLPRQWRALPLLAVTPALLVGTIVFVSVGGPMVVRWDMSQEAFARAASSAPASAAGMPTVVSERIGWYDVAAVQRLGTDVIFTTSPGGFGAGFAYLPKGVHSDEFPQASGSMMFQAMGGDWYAWDCSAC